MKTRLLLIFILASLFMNSFGQKIAGYLPSYRNPSPTLIQYSKLTHVLFSFVNPNSSGVLVGVNTPNIGNANYDFDMNNFIVAKANCYPMVPNGPKLVISVGGADAGNVRANNLSTVCGAAGTRATLVSQLVAFAITHNLDGIDIDWEFPTSAAAKNNHQALLADLRTAINASANPNIRIGVALGGETLGGTNHTQYINAAALTYVDDFNLMAYDLPNNGLYNASNHAALADMTALINNWNTFGVPKAKMVLGVPFYGRTAGRSAINGEWNVFTAGYTAGQLATALGSDGPSVTGSFYYNGKPTLEAKVDLIITTHCGQGVMIWDVGQDRTDAYSLLNVLYNRINTSTCTIANPSLGADINLCGANTTLNATTPAAAGRTFDWKRNGVLITNTTANTYAATQGGTWTVTAKEGCCKKTDEVIITQGAAITATGATRCGTGTLNLNVTSTGSTYDWFDANTNGTYLNTGASFTTPSISTTTTYYVQQNAGNGTYYTGKAYPATSPQKEYADYMGRAHWANKMVVSQTLTIKSVDIYYSGPAISNARLIAYSSVDGTSIDYQSAAFNLVAQTTTALAAGFHYTLNANLTLPPGTYYMAIFAPGADAQGANPGVTLDPNGIATPYTQTGLFSIEGKASVNWGGGFNAAAPGANYGQLFNWVIAAANNPCGRTAVVATINCPPTVSLTSPAPPGPVTHNAGTALTLTATASDDGSVTGVVYEIRNATTNALITTVPGGAGPTYSASWTPPSNIQYKVRAVATDNSTLTNSTSDVIVDVILPVTLLYFEAQKENETVLLTWATTTEINNDKFILERSADGIEFSPIGSVAGQGNSNAIFSYSFTDTDPLSGTSYYRLAQYDYDGTRENSEIKSVNFNEEISITIAPNPFGETTVLTSSSKAYTLKILSLQGTLIEEKTCESNCTVVEIGQNLKPGFYLLILSTDEHTITHKIEKLN